MLVSGLRLRFQPVGAYAPVGERVEPTPRRDAG